VLNLIDFGNFELVLLIYTCDFNIFIYGPHVTELGLNYPYIFDPTQ